MKGLIDYITKKFFVGLTLIILSLVIGNLAKLILLLYFGDLALRKLMLTIYLLSWPMLFLGVWFAGKDYYDAVRKYFSYKYYHQSLRKSAKRAIDTGKNYHQSLQKGARQALQRGKKVSSHVKGKLKKIRKT